MVGYQYHLTQPTWDEKQPAAVFEEGDEPLIVLSERGRQICKIVNHISTAVLVLTTACIVFLAIFYNVDTIGDEVMYILIGVNTLGAFVWMGTGMALLEEEHLMEEEWWPVRRNLRSLSRASSNTWTVESDRASISSGES